MEPEAIPLPELPPIPVGDRFADTKVFRSLGRGGAHALFECWDEAVHEYAQAYARAAVLAERERCARVCEEHARITWDDEEGALACAAAIRSGTAPAQEG